LSRETSSRQIVRSSTIVGGASLLNILLGIVRTKVAALLLGPAGVGLIGLYTSIMSTAATLAGLGFGSVGTRQIAEAAARDDPSAVAVVRRALRWGTLCLSLAGGLTLWLLRETLARLILSDASRADDVGLLALGVALTVGGASQVAVLNGLRRIGDLSRISALSALFGTLAGVTLLWRWGEHALIAFILVGPLATFLLGHLYVARLPKAQSPRTPLPELAKQWRRLVQLGSAFMLTGLAGMLAYLLVRTLVKRDLGVEALGHFQAAWLVSMTYLGFVLQPMIADFYPRLTGVIHQHAQANRLVNEQVEITLLLAGPILLAMLGLAPWVIEVLYTDRFQPAVNVLRWQTLGDIFRVTSLPLGYVILSAGDGRTYLASDCIGLAVLLALTWLGLPRLGLETTGIAFFATYAAYLPLVYWLARRRTGFRWAPATRRQLLLLAAAGVAVLLAARWVALVGATCGLLLSSVFALYALGRLTELTDQGGVLGRIGGICRRAFTRLRIHN
jgi:O-antigen/teichoic acid export membrane protein